MSTPKFNIFEFWKRVPFRYFDIYRNEYNEFINKVKLLSYLNPDQDFFNEYFIVVVPVTNSSSTIENKYINCFVKEEQLYFNFTMLDNKNALWDYYEDLFFIKINNKYLDSEFYKIITYI